MAKLRKSNEKTENKIPTYVNNTTQVHIFRKIPPDRVVMAWYLLPHKALVGTKLSI